jgi:outer membrane protein
MKTKFFLLNALLMLGISVGSMLVYHKCIKQQAAYIDIKKVFNSFQMKKELEEKYKVVQKQRDRVLDSLQGTLRIISRELSEQKMNANKIDENLIRQFEYKRDEYLKTKERFEEDNAMLSQKYDSQILERMTAYIIEYGKKNKYDFIYGADGNGSLMYSNDRYDLSDEIAVYINNKYKGQE